MRTKTKRFFSLFMALALCFSLLGTIPAFAATTVQAYMVNYPRQSDPNYGDSRFGHSANYLMSGWAYVSYERMTLHAIGSYNGQIAYCIEPGVDQDSGDTLTSQDESYWDNYPASSNVTIPPDTIKTLLGRVLTYGYHGNISQNWMTGNASDADSLSYAIATQMLVWEVVVGERDENFDHVDPSSYGKGAVMDYIGASNPLRAQIMSYYNQIIENIKTHNVMPSFCAPSRDYARAYELEQSGGEYTLTLTDSNGVLDNYAFSADLPGISFSKSGNRLTITCDTPTEDTILVTAEKQNAYSSSLVIWSDGTWSKAGIQDTITYGENVSDPVNGYFELEMDAAGGLRIVKTSEDGNVSGIEFTITGEGCSERVRTGSDGTIEVTGLMPGRYAVTETNSDAYTPQDSQTVTISGGESAVVTFNNTLKRGALQVRKSAEDNFIEGITFHLYGTSASGLEVDEYAVTGADGVAHFENVLISGNTPYTIEEVDPAERYVVPESQTVSILWDDVAERSFQNVLKKFSVTVTKTDAETGTPRGDATLAGAAYGLYRGGELIDTYYTDENGQFTTAEYPCGDDWTIREISPSEGYLLDESVHSVGALPGQYTVEHNVTAIGVTEELIEGSIRIIKHIDAADEDVEIVPSEPSPEPSAEPSPEPTLEPSQEPIPETNPVPSDEPGDAGSAASGNEESPIPDDPEALPSPSKVPETGEPPAEGVPEESEPPAEETSEVSEPPAEEAEPSEPPVEEDPTLSPEPIDPGEVDTGDKGEAIEQPEEGAVFQIYLASAGSYEAAAEDERDILTTDADGIAVSKSLPYAQYCVHQIDGVPGLEFAPDFTVFISEDGKLYSYILNDARITSLIRIEKRDAETGDIITATGAGFQIRKLTTGELVTQTVNYPSPSRITTFYTDDTGTLMLPEALPYGEYELIEVAACHGYILDSTPVPFTVDGSENIVTVVKYNSPQMGIIRVSKVGEVFASINESDGLYTPVYETGGYAGAAFTIAAAEDILAPDGSVRIAAGTVVDTITTGSDGIASSNELYLGKYVITEASAPHGMVLNNVPQTVELAYAGQDISLVELEVTFLNERQRAQISLSKSMALDEKFGIGTNGEISAVSFGLYAAADIAAADNSAIPVGGLIEIAPVNADGTAAFTSDIPLGSYYVQEYSTDSHYILSNERYPVEFTYAGQDTPLVNVAVNDGEAIVNELKYGSVSGMKLDENGKALSGALFGLFRSDAVEFTEEGALMTATSGEDGIFVFENLPVGDYIVRELMAPAGYVLSEELHQVSIAENAQIIELEVTNDPIRGSITLTKYDADYPDNRLTGAVFEVYRDVNGDQVPDDGDELLGEMDDEGEGVYWMRELEAGGYLVRETKAPEGYVLDETAYYVEITTNGEVCVVENEAGVGFLNQPLRGALKIVKTTDDGRVEGFAFRVSGVNGYDMTFTTDANGKILIDGLRIGEYVVTELENGASEGYEIADPVTVTLVANETLTVNVHNTKITVDVPKTGDDSLTPWIILTAAGLAGVAGVGAYYYFAVYRKGKGGKRNEKA